MKKLIKRIISFFAVITIVPILCAFAAGFITDKARSAGNSVYSAVKELSFFGGREAQTSAKESAAQSEKNEELTFLITGIDEVGNNSDVIILVSYDCKENGASVLQIPRDTYINSESYPFHKINAIYTYAYNKSIKDQKDVSKAIKAGNSELCAFIEDTFCLDIDCFFSVSSKGFGRIVNSVGGVDISIPFDIDYDDESQNLHIHFKKGENHLDGADAEKFIRFRSGYISADYGRMDAQKMLLCALAEKIQKGLTLPRLISLTKELYSNITTNMPLSEMLSFIPSAFKADMDKITLLTLKGRSVTVDGTMYEVQNKKYTYKVIDKYFKPGKLDISDIDKKGALNSPENETINGYYTDTAPFSINGYKASEWGKIADGIPIKKKK